MDALSVLQRLGTRRFIDELGETLSSVADEVTVTRKKGKVTVTFTVNPAPGDEAGVTVNEEIKRTPPVKNPRGAYFFSIEGELHERDPRQPEMDFRTVAKSSGEVVTVDGNSTVISVERGA